MLITLLGWFCWYLLSERVAVVGIQQQQKREEITWLRKYDVKSIRKRHKTGYIEEFRSGRIMTKASGFYNRV
jgi:hypothetical protein